MQLKVNRCLVHSDFDRFFAFVEHLYGNVVDVSDEAKRFSNFLPLFQEEELSVIDGACRDHIHSVDNVEQVFNLPFNGCEVVGERAKQVTMVNQYLNLLDRHIDGWVVR